MVLDKLNNQLQISYKSTIAHLFYLFKPIAYLTSQVKRKCVVSNKNACNLSVCQVVRTKISISKFFDTTHNGIVRGKYSTKISISGIF